MKYYFESYITNGLENRYPRMTTTYYGIKIIVYNEKTNKIISIREIIGLISKSWEKIKIQYEANQNIENQNEIEFKDLMKYGILYTNKGKVSIIKIEQRKLQYERIEEGVEIDENDPIEVLIEMRFEDLAKVIKHRNYIYANYCDYGTLVEGKIYDTNDQHIAYTLTNKDLERMRAKHESYKYRSAKVEEIGDKLIAQGSKESIVDLFNYDFKSVEIQRIKNGTLLIYNGKVYSVKKCEVYYLLDYYGSIEVIVEAQKVGLEEEYEKTPYWGLKYTLKLKKVKEEKNILDELEKEYWE